jgi:hypothetical protein
MHIAIILVLIFFPFNNHVEAKKIESEVSIIPQPAFVQYTSDGFFSLSSRTAVLLYDSDDLELVVDDFISQFYNASGIKLNKTCQYNLKFFDNQIRFVNDVDLADEEYHVKINKNQIIVSCASNAGAFYAIQTLKQLLPVDIYSKTQIRKDHVNLKLLEIRDKPRFKYRGLMLDVSRHYMPVSFIKELIDVMSLLKLNRFHWHLTDDQGWRIEIKKYPLLTEFGSIRKQTSVGNWRDSIYDGKEYRGYYTQEEAREVVEYAAKRYITVIPEIELPGHALAAIAAYPVLSCNPDKKYEVGQRWGVFEEVFCTRDTVFHFLQNVFSELFDIFPSEFYHIGGDECPKKSWKVCQNWLLQGAESLSTRFRSATGLIRSWDWNKKVWNYPVIIDNMMNLELLEWASKHSDSTKYANIARSHADKTMEHHFRPDYSTWHVVSYDPATGLPEKKQTRQGYADESTWSRGQAWALYGYVMMYRESNDIRYLKQAENIAGFILNHPNLPKDKIPYWDFNAPDIPHAKKDASAGAIMASAFIELSQMTKGRKSKGYLSVAITQLLTLSSPEYLAEPGTNANFILKHSVGSLPENSEVDVPLTYADYYFLEALIRYKKIK